jgi:predicted signal transduction protein with EAL and GGDEF domain
LLGTVMGITQRKQTELRQGVEHTVAQLLAEAESPLEAMPRILETTCAALGWVCGAYWQGEESTDGPVDGSREAQADIGQGAKQEVLCRRTTWTAMPSTLARFHADSDDRLPLEGPEDLIRRAALLGDPVWMDDVTKDAHFVQRRSAAVAAGLRAAFAFPIHVGGRLAGVVEFFDVRAQESDKDLLASARALGRQIGQFLHRKQAEEHVRHLAFHDALTNLPNRAMFNRQLNHAIARAARQMSRLAVLFIDLDRFKIINDTLGHDAGDRLLQEMARRLALSLRQSDLLSRLGKRDEPEGGDVLARLGGDEFVVLIEDVGDATAVVHVARKLLAALLVPYRLKSQPVHITASIGVAIFPEDGKDEHTLMRHADNAMYRAKEAGKNNYQFYSPQMDQHSHALLALESELRFALRRREFRLHYQAKFDVSTGRITGAEALLRWQHPTNGLMMPAHFIALAEETGLILPLGKWVLEQACAQNRAWQRSGLPPLRMAVNLSARQFGDEKLLTDIATCLARTGMNPSLLELEITESAVMHDPDKAVHVLEQLKTMGVRVAIDDFGVGYSSLVQLKRLPIDIIKVDRSFIKDCPDDIADVAITQAVIAIAKSLDLQVVAEGVETARQLQFVRDCGCEEIQGFLFGLPVPAEEFANFCRDDVASPRSAAGVLAGPAAPHVDGQGAAPAA